MKQHVEATVPFCKSVLRLQRLNHIKPNVPKVPWRLDAPGAQTVGRNLQVPRNAFATFCTLQLFATFCNL